MIMKQQLKDLLVTAAVNGETPYYSVLANQLHLKPKPSGGYDKKFYKLLTDIGSDELSQGLPLLNALVIGKKDELPSKGFFIWYKAAVHSKFDCNSLDAKQKLFDKLKEEAFLYCQKKLIPKFAVLDSELPQAYHIS